jgi:hypothetical protein
MSSKPSCLADVSTECVASYCSFLTLSRYNIRFLYKNFVCEKTSTQPSFGIFEQESHNQLVEKQNNCFILISETEKLLMLISSQMTFFIIKKNLLKSLKLVNKVEASITFVAMVLDV